MPLFLIPLVTWFGSTTFALALWFVTRKGLLFVAMVALIALVGTAITLLVSETDTLLGSILPSSIGFVTPFIPDNTAACISVIISCELACTAFSLTMRFIEWKARVLIA